MPVEVKVPEVGESVTEVYVGQWHKAEGDDQLRTNRWQGDGGRDRQRPFESR